MPLTYLGIPLKICRPTCAQLQPQVDSVAAKLPTWKAHLMDKAGRLKLIKSVLSAIPIHQLLVYAPRLCTAQENPKAYRENPARILVGWSQGSQWQQLPRELEPGLPSY
jgi:hypothetical protein